MRCPSGLPPGPLTSWAPTGPTSYDPTSGIPLLLTDGAVSYLHDDAGNPLQQIDAAGVGLYYQHDQYGSTRLLTNQAGTVAATFTYDPYGNLTGKTGTADTPLRWNGQHQDTGHYYLRVRYHDPTTAQFLTRDPLIALTGSAYGYVEGDPLNASDPLGLYPYPYPHLNPFSAAGDFIDTVAGIDLGSFD
jgi:RHS repeat-associated protein